MQAIKFFLLTSLFAILISGCNSNEDKLIDDYLMTSAHLVQTYIIANDFDLEVVDNIDSSGGYAVKIFFEGQQASILPPANKEDFHRWANHFQDTSYNGKVIPNANKALTNKIGSIGIVCDKDYDAEHQAGTPLGDIVLFCGTSPYDFIQRGYKDNAKGNCKYPDYWYHMVMNRGAGYEPVEMLVSQFAQDKSLMLYPISYLYFKKRPQQGGIHTFTVSMKIGDTEVSKTIRHRF